MPSPASRTRPTSSRWSVGANWLAAWRNAAEISSGLMLSSVIYVSTLVFVL